MEVKFPLNEAQSRCGHASIKKNPVHPTMFKIFVGSTFYVSCQQTVVLIGEGGMRGFYNSHVFQKLHWQAVIFHNNFQCKISGFCCGVVEDFTLLGCYMHSLAVGS